MKAVEQFAWLHEAGLVEEQRYRALLPLAKPEAGQQYAFEVDLDACTGCKACVTGCHNMNGLDEGESWRTVGLLHGGSAEAPVLRTVTTACHHCVEPACMIGCPVKAYEKEPITGIVKHLDDQCIGCQYCVFMCPYDAPKYNAARGIVRKCDLCSDRLKHDEAPACAQACPNQAIKVVVVDQAQAVEASTFLPGAPAPDDTLPTTSYRTRRELPRNLLAADFYAVKPEAAHPPLAVMLVLTQLSVGAFGVIWLSRASTSLSTSGPWVALLLCLAALGASVLHLGRPRYAFRALLGLRTSWLSREIVAFSGFAGLAGLYAATLDARLLPAVAVSGGVGVICSMMVYEATRRPSWRLHRVAPLFLLSTVILGAATVLVVAPATPRLTELLAAATGLKLLLEATGFLHLRSRRHTALKRRAILMAGDLVRISIARFLCGAVGGLALPLLASGRIGAAFALALVLTGELLERHLFFAAATASRMPGTPS
jgi:Fe-S-cluster-containing dehydrogenase component/DMSO reductase anchor subunit